MKNWRYSSYSDAMYNLDNFQVMFVCKKGSSFSVKAITKAGIEQIIFESESLDEARIWMHWFLGEND